jgi:hypothetical protein
MTWRNILHRLTAELRWFERVTVVTYDFHDGIVVVTVCFWVPQLGGHNLDMVLPKKLPCHIDPP